MQSNQFNQHSYQSNNQNYQGGNNQQQNNNPNSKLIDKAFIRLVRKYIPKKVSGQIVFQQGTQIPVMTPLYKTIGEVHRWAAQTPSGYFDKVEMYPGETILDGLTDGTLDWDSQRQNNNQRG